MSTLPTPPTLPTPRRHTTRILCASALAALTLALASADARAQGAGDYPPCTKKAAGSDIDAAKGAHKAASEFNERGDYEKAIQYWRDAYGFDCSAHALLINIANAYEKKGDRAAAIIALETYQSRTGGTNQTIGEKLAKLKASAAAAPQVVTPPPDASTTAPAAQPPPPPSPAGERPFGIAPWIVVGGGGALIIVGAILLPVGFSAISDAESRCGGGHSCPEDVAADGNSGRTKAGIGWAALGVGVAAVGGGLAWQFLGNKPSEATRIGIPLPGPLSAVAALPVLDANERGLRFRASF